MKTIILLLVIIASAFTSCGTTKNIVDSATLEGVWHLDSISGTTESLDKMYPIVKPLIAFTTDHRVSGTNGCNRFMGSFSIPKTDKIKFGPLAETKMACEGVDENFFDSRLQKVTNYDIGDGGKTLRLLSNGILVMQFVKK